MERSGSRPSACARYRTSAGCSAPKLNARRSGLVRGFVGLVIVFVVDGLRVYEKPVTSRNITVLN